VIFTKFPHAKFLRYWCRNVGSSKFRIFGISLALRGESPEQFLRNLAWGSKAWVRKSKRQNPKEQRMDSKYLNLHHIYSCQRHKLTTEMLSCTALRPAPSRNFNVCRTTQLGSCSKCQHDPTPSCCCTACTDCRLIRESSIRWRSSHSKSSVLTQPHNCVWNLRSSDTPRLCYSFTKTYLARRGFHYSAPAVWNSLPRTVLESLSVTVFKSRLKTQPF